MFLKYAYFLVSITILTEAFTTNPKASVTNYLSTSTVGVLSPLRFKDSEDIEQLSKQRPYGAFVAEKAFEYLEGSSKQPHNPKEKENLVKEKIVVLGTGWASTAFLKNIDTDLYDVTVISPRNYFLFTPMLAGASVGSLEYRSITEPVREVRNNIPQVKTCHGHIPAVAHSSYGL